MTPEQALSNLDNAVARMELSREQHFILQQSVVRLQQALQELKKQPQPEPQE